MLGGRGWHGRTSSALQRRAITPFVLLDLEQQFFCAATFKNWELSAAGFLVYRLKESPDKAILNRHSQIPCQLLFSQRIQKEQQKDKGKGICYPGSHTSKVPGLVLRALPPLSLLGPWESEENNAYYQGRVSNTAPHEANFPGLTKSDVPGE